MKTKYFVTTIVVFSVVILILGILLASAYRKIDEYELGVKNEYSKNLSELGSAVNSITLLLNKARYTASPTVMSSFASELFSEAEIAKNALSQLPLTERPETLQRFLSQVGNYALSLSKSVIRGESLNLNEEENLKILAETSKTIAEAIALTDTTYNNSEYWATELENTLNSAESSAFADSLTQLEENLTDYPTLIYDGPYSDHIITKRPIFLENKPTIDVSEAYAKLQTVFGFSGDEVKYSGEQNGRIECYNFSGESINAAVSKKGGYLVYYLKNRDISENKLDYSKAILKASKFLEIAGYKNMQDTYYFTDSGVCVVNFAFLDGQTLCYTDLIKVGVALDNGEIMFFEATGYLFNHTERAFKTSTYSADEARQKLNQKLTVKNYKIVLIPTDSTAERRCYEFLCSGDNNEEMLIYINVNTLEEEQIFILLKSDGGTLVK